MELLAAAPGMGVILFIVGLYCIVKIIDLVTDPPEDVTEFIAYLVAAMAGFCISVIGLFTIAISYIFKGYGL